MHSVNIKTNAWAIIPLATIDAIDLISMDFLNLDIKKLDYGYDKDMKEQSNWHLDEEIMKAHFFCWRCWRPMTIF